MEEDMVEIPMRLDTAAAARYLSEILGIPVEERPCATDAPLARIAALPAGILALSRSTISPNSIDGRRKMHCRPKIRCAQTCVYAKLRARDRSAIRPAGSRAQRNRQ